MIRLVVQRALLACVAVGAIVVLAIWLHSSRLEAKGEAFKPSPSNPVTPGQVRTALSEFDRARHNNPDTKPELDEATILIFLGRNAEASRLLGDVVHKEPRNAGAWALLSRATSRSDPKLSAAAVARVRELAPPLGR
jgi:hypothetical protein